MFRGFMTFLLMPCVVVAALVIGPGALFIGVLLFYWVCRTWFDHEWAIGMTALLAFFFVTITAGLR